MYFNSFDFLLFFVVVLATQAVLPQRPRNWWLLAASYFFYAYWDWRFLGLIWLSTAVDFICSHRLAATRNRRSRKVWLWTSVLFNLSVLATFKYFGFFVSSLESAVTGEVGHWSDWTRHIVLPMGISFYTFQTMSYTIDVYRRQLKPLKRLSDFALYVAFFPQLVAGPIERGAHLAPQIAAGRRTTWHGIQAGSVLVLSGFFKKLVIADNMAVIVGQVFGAADPTGLEVVIAVYAFALQIYGDFAGYTDIARGLARMMGYDLMLNFRMPYLAISPSDFWQRWHISLSSWLRDYLYIPLGGNRGGSLITARNLMITMLLGGLWHGAAWNFVLWGLYHGILLILFRVWIPEPGPARFSLGWWVRVAVMFHLTCLGWLLFRVESLAQLGQLSLALASGWSLTPEIAPMLWMVGLLGVPLMLLHVVKEKTHAVDLVGQLSIVPRTAVYAGMLFMIVSLGKLSGQEFIYFQF